MEHFFEVLAQAGDFILERLQRSFEDLGEFGGKFVPDT